MQIGIIADDLTGAMDSGAKFARAGYRTAVAFLGSTLPPAPDLDAVAVDTDSRNLQPDAAQERVLDAARKLRDSRILYKKLDSTLRGPIAAELETALEACGRSRAIIAPAFPAAGRTTRGGVQLLYGEPLHETPLAEDPATPVRESHLPSLLADAGLHPVGVLSVEDLKDSARLDEVFEASRWIVADAAQDGDLEALVEAVPNRSEVLWVGSAGLVGALGEVYPGKYFTGLEDGPPVEAARVLTVVGSRNPTVRHQLKLLDESSAATLVSLESQLLVDGSGAALDAAMDECRHYLGKGMNVALHTTEDEISPVDTGRTVEALAQAVSVLSDEGLFDALVLTGGDTAVHVARSLGARGIRVDGEIEPGVPVGNLISDPPYRVITKAGGFGMPETLLRAQKFFTGKGAAL